MDEKQKKEVEELILNLKLLVGNNRAMIEYMQANMQRLEERIDNLCKENKSFC